MPLILHIETATKVCSVALSRAEEVLSVRESRESYRHAEQLGLFIRQVTEEAGVAIPGLSAVAVSIGPGSYTGLRIGLSTAKGLCYGAGLKLIALPTLRCLANGIRKKMSATATDGLLCPMIDARRQEVYAAVYNKELKTLSGARPYVLDKYTFARELQKGKMYFAGDGAAKFSEMIPHQEHAIFLPGLLPSSVFMITLALQAYNAGDFADIAYTTPFYLKEFIAGKPRKLL